MPYIVPEQRAKIEPHLNATAGLIQNVGDLTYAFYVLAINYVGLTGLRYVNVCGVMGALLCCALEFYRKVISGYEDSKIKENGDVVCTVKPVAGQY